MSHRPASSPVLVGRDDLLDLVDRRLAATRAGKGELLLVAGEAGIGKTRLLDVVRRRAATAGVTVAAGAASPYDRDIVGGVLLDLGRSLAADDRTRDAGQRVLELLAAPAVETAPASRRGRILALQLADVLCEVAAAGPALLVIDDLHWSDELSLEALERVARRAPSLPLLVCAAYRSDDAAGGGRLREWRALLLAQRRAEEIHLRRLTASETRTVLASILGADTPLVALAGALHLRSDGIPLHIEEMLAALRARSRPVDVAAMPVPDTLGVAVLERAQRVSATALEVARTASVIGRAFALDLLESVAGLDPTALDRALGELYEQHLLTRDEEAGHLHFRHGLICDAIYEAIPRSARRMLHARVAAEAGARGDADAAYVAAQFDRGGDRASALRWSLRAARAASALSAHRASDAAYRIAVRNLDGTPPRERANILAEHAAEAQAVDDNASAARAYEEARGLLRSQGDRLAAAELAAPLASVRHLLGAGLEERRALLETALADLDDIREGEVLGTRARLETALASAYMLDRRLDRSAAAGELALRHARAAGDRATEVNTLVTVGTVKVFAGQMEAGWSMLEDGITQARAMGLEAEAARGYRMIGSTASIVVEYARAERWLREGISYAERIELWNHRHYMAAHLGHVLWATGRWEEAGAVLGELDEDARGGLTTRITALHVGGYLALGRDDHARAEGLLAEARALAERMGELQRLSPALWGQAELALLRGDARAAVDATTLGREASERVRDTAYLFPFVVTGTRARLVAGDLDAAATWARDVGALVRERGIPGTLPAIDHALGLVLAAQGSTGRARDLIGAARRAWLARGRWWEATWAGLDLARCDLRAGRVDEALHGARETALAAAASGAAAVVRVADELTGIASARGGLVEPWAPLTAREFDVARRIGAGLTNAEIASELRIAPRTVATHVEHILSKLGAARRAEIAAWVAARGSTGDTARPTGGSRTPKPRMRQ